MVNAVNDADRSPDIPVDLIFIILTHLPAKSALRFRTVSKSCNSFIVSPSFTRHHHSLALRRNPTTFLASVTKWGILSYRVELTWIAIDSLVNSVSTFPEAYGTKFIREFTNMSTFVGDSCYGVFCISHGVYNVLWNPAIREVSIVKNNSGNKRCIGFGAIKDALSNVVDFKILFCVINRSNEEEDIFDGFEIYSLRADSWTSVRYPGFPVMIGYFFMDYGRYLNGVRHWLINNYHATYILTFDFVSETFGKIDLPCIDHGNIVVRCKKFLSVVDNQYLQFSMVDREAGCLNLWVLKENGDQRSWIRGKSVEYVNYPVKILTLRYLNCIKGVISISRSNDGKFWLHVKGSSGVHDTRLDGHQKWYEYAESLVSLKGIAGKQ